jgi:hypothetical protein
MLVPSQHFKAIGEVLIACLRLVRALMVVVLSMYGLTLQARLIRTHEADIGCNRVRPVDGHARGVPWTS